MYRDYLIFPLAEIRTDAIVAAIGRGSRAFATRSPVKRRECAVIHYVLRGSGWFDGIKISAGQGFYFSPNEDHDYYGLNDGDWEYVFIEFAAQFADRIVVPSINADEHGVFSFSFIDWLQKWADENIGNEPLSFITEAEAVYRATSIIRRHAEEKNANESKQLLYVRKAQIFIEKNIGKHLQASDVAKALNLNPRYLCKLFVQHTGSGIKTCITEQKMQYAKALLAETTLPIKEIALEIGIDDPNTFSKIFRHQLGISPSDYRNSRSN